MKYIQNKGFISHQHQPMINIFLHESKNFLLDTPVYHNLVEALYSNSRGCYKIDKDETDGDHTYFCKSNRLLQSSERRRATFGIKSKGTYYRSVAEIENAIRLRTISYVPKIVAYGYSTSRLGIVKSTVLLLEYIEDSMTVLQCIEQNPDKMQAALQLSFEQIAKCFEDGFIHLDLWIDNIIVDPSLSLTHVIDLEYCLFDSNETREKQIGFCLGYLYRHTLSNFLSFDEYFKILREWLLNNMSITSAEKMEYHATYSAMNKIRKPQRFKIFSGHW